MPTSLCETILCCIMSYKTMISEMKLDMLSIAFGGRIKTTTVEIVYIYICSLYGV